MKKAVWWCIFKGNECESTQWPLKWLKRVASVSARGRTGSERACICISHTDGSLKTPLHARQCPADVDQQVTGHVFHEKANSSETEATSVSDLAWRLSIKLIDRVPSVWSFMLLWSGGSPGWSCWTPTPPLAFDYPEQAQVCCNTVCMAQLIIFDMGWTYQHQVMITHSNLWLVSALNQLPR